MLQVTLKNESALKYFNEGKKQFENSQYELAAEYFDVAFQIKPDYIEAYFKKGRCFGYLQQYAKAIECYDVAIKLNANLISAYNYKGFCFKFLSKEKESEECFIKAFVLNSFPNDAHSYLNKGLSIFGLKNNIDALLYYDKAIHVHSQHILAYFYKGYVLYKMKKTN